MAEAIVIVGAIAACSQLEGSFAKLGRFIKNAIKGIKNIPQFIVGLKGEIKLFEVSVRKLLRAARQAYSENDDTDEARETADAVEQILNDGKKLKSKIYSFIRNSMGKKSDSTWQRWIKDFRLSSKQAGVQCLQNSLSRLLQHINVLGTGVLLETLQVQIRDLMAHNQQVPQRLLAEM